MSKRTDIKRKIESVLNAANIANANIFSNRKKAHFNSTFPMVEIYSLRGNSERENSRVNHYRRNLDVVIKVVNESKSEEDFDLSESLDGITAQIENELMKDITLDGLTIDIEVKDFEETFEPSRVLMAAQGTVFKITYQERL